MEHPGKNPNLTRPTQKWLRYSKTVSLVHCDIMMLQIEAYQEHMVSAWCQYIIWDTHAY